MPSRRFTTIEQFLVPEIIIHTTLFLDGNMRHKETDEARRQASRLSKIGSTEEVESGDADDVEVEEEEEAEQADEVRD